MVDGQKEHKTLHDVCVLCGASGNRLTLYACDEYQSLSGIEKKKPLGVEGLLLENQKLHDSIIYGFHEEGHPTYIQGGGKLNDLCEIATAEEVNDLVAECCKLQDRLDLSLWAMANAIQLCSIEGDYVAYNRVEHTKIHVSRHADLWECLRLAYESECARLAHEQS